MRPLDVSRVRVVRSSQLNGELFFSALLTRPQLRPRRPLVDNGVGLLHPHASFTGYSFELVHPRVPTPVSESSKRHTLVLTERKASRRLD